MRYRKPVRGYGIWWLRLAGLAAFLVLLLRLPRSGEVQLSHIDLRWLALCILCTLLQPVLESLAWQWMLWKQGIRHPFPKTLLAHMASQYLGLVTPGHVGDFLGAGYISMNTGITIGYALSSVVMRKTVAWIAMIGFSIWALPLLAQLPAVAHTSMKQEIARIGFLSLGILAFLALGIGIWIFSLRQLAKRWQRLSAWQIDMTEFWSGFKLLWSPDLAVPLLISALEFSLFFVQLGAVLWALGLPVAAVAAAKIVALSRIAARLLPLSVAGFGSKDAVVIELLAAQGIDRLTGLTVTLVLLLCSHLLTLVVSGVCWWVKPLVIPRAEPSRSRGSA